jgi:2'-5' RNA ligase
MPDIITPFEIARHPLRGTKEISSERIVLVAAEMRAADGASDERPIVEITSTSTGEDRHGSTIIEWDDATFMRTGHVLWAHDIVPAYPFVGKKLSSRKVGNKSVSEVELLVNLWRHMNCNLAAFLWEAYRDHGMGAMSRAFIPKVWKNRTATTIPTELAENIEYLKVEQTEESFVNVPSNRDSLARAIERKRTAGTFNDQLARMLGYEFTPIILRTEKEPSMPTRTLESFRSDLAGVLTRCGCEPYREPKPESLTDEEKTTELALMTEMAVAILATMDVALRGWKATLENFQRNIYTNVVVDAMYRIEGLIWRAKEWYGADLVLAIPELSADDMERIASAAPGAATRGIRYVQRTVLPTTERAATRAKVTELLRCCGCGPYEEPKPTLPSDDATRAAEVTILRELADLAMQLAEAGMRGWKGAETEQLRGMSSSRVYDGMWLFDWCARSLSEWYGEEIDAMPTVDLVEVERALKGSVAGIRAGAVFAKKNLEKIDQVIEIMTELRAAANKPTADDIPAEERKRQARAVQFIRMAGPFEFASTQVNLEGEAAEKILALAATIPDDALAEKGRETEPHVTVKFGIDPEVGAVSLAETIENSDSAKEMAERGATMTLGATAIFEADEYDVVFVTVDSPDLLLLNKIISEDVPVTDTHPEYIPHVTLAYVKKGEGQKFAGDETLAGTIVTFDAITYSDVDGNTTDIQFAAEAARAETETGERSGIRINGVPIEQIAGVTSFIRIKDTGSVAREHVTTSQPIRVLAPDASRDRREESPATGRSGLYVKLLSD